MLVYAFYLEEVEKVAGSSMDPDEVFVWLGDGIWNVGDFELFRTLLDLY